MTAIRIADLRPAGIGEAQVCDARAPLLLHKHRVIPSKAGTYLPGDPPGP